MWLLFEFYLSTDIDNIRMWLYEKIHISILGNRVSVTYSKEV